MRKLLDLDRARNRGSFTHGLGGMALWMGVLMLAAGCGASARSDFDLNRGEARGPNRAEAQAAFGGGMSEEPGAQEEWRYRIQGGDELEVVFFTHPDQNRFVTVRPDGYVTLPYLGDVKAEDKTPEDLAGELQETYAEVLVSPRVDVIVQKMGARFYVLGEVLQPGEFEYERRIDIMQALAAAGGYEDSARLSNIVLLRKGYGSEKSFAAVLNLRDYMGSENRSGSLQVRPYDIVWVPRSNISRWDNATNQLLQGILDSQDVVIKGWSLANFKDVYERQRF